MPSCVVQDLENLLDELERECRREASVLSEGER